jgi:ABC-2 type transport system ATP-binding protein
VLVSSHLLAEVEQACTDVIVMRGGEVVAAGPVDEMVGDSPTVHIAVSHVDAAAAVAALARAGVGVDRVVPGHRLEDAFLSLVGAAGER